MADNYGLLRIGDQQIDAPARFDVTDPATDDVIGSCPNATPAHITAAIDAASRAFRDWRKTPATNRSDILQRIHHALVAEADQLAHLITSEAGKPLRESTGEVQYAADFAAWFAAEARRIDGRTTIGGQDGRTWQHLVRQPIGVVAAITPWNYPLVLTARKVFAAIAAGATVLLKPSELTPLSALALGTIAEHAGLPPGVLNIVTANPPDTVGDLIANDPRVRMISFTGSVTTGKRLMAAGARTLTRVGLELGGNNAFLVFEDADLDAAVAAALVAKLRNGGQTCVCANRLYVHETLIDEFTDRFTHAMQTKVAGPGIDPATDIGPLIDPHAANRIQHAIDYAVQAGARLTCGGTPTTRPSSGGGAFYPPTVIRDVPPGAQLLSEETFGPVAPIIAFHDTDDLIATVNATEYGLAAYAFTTNLHTALQVSEDLETGIVVINRAAPSGVEYPQGGIKQSGIGLEGGHEGIDEFMISKYITLGH